MEQTAFKVVMHCSNYSQLGGNAFFAWNPWQRAAKAAESKPKYTEYRNLNHYLFDRRGDFG